MKVLQVVKTDVGASWAFLQAKWLVGRGVDMVTVLPSLDGEMAEAYRQCGLKTVKGDFALPVRRPWELGARIDEVRRVVADVEPDLVHCHFVTNIMMVRLALRQSGIPRVFQVPGPLHLEHRFFRLAEIWLATGVDHWAGACRRTCDLYLHAGIPSARIHLAYYGGAGGSSCDEYSPNAGRLHKEFGLSEGATLVGMVSYFYPPKRYLLQRRGLKGHEDFIEAIALVRSERPDVLGMVVGDAWGGAVRYFERVKRYAWKRCGRGVMFAGLRTDMKAIYREFDVAVHPSHSENQGGAGESLAAGVPTISTTVGGFPDIVINGRTGYTVRPKHPRELAEAIIHMIDDPVGARDMAQTGQQLARSMFDIDQTGAEVLRIYGRVLYESRGAGAAHG